MAFVVAPFTMYSTTFLAIAAPTYNSLKALLAHMIEAGLSSKERQEGIYFAESLDEIKRILHLA